MSQPRSKNIPNEETHPSPTKILIPNEKAPGYFSGIRTQAESQIPDFIEKPKVKRKSTYATFLSDSFVQKHEKLFTGIVEGLLVNSGTFPLERWINNIRLSQKTTASEALKAIIKDPKNGYSIRYVFKGFAPAATKSATQLGLIYTAQPIIEDLFRDLFPGHTMHSKFSLGFAAMGSRSAVYFLSVVEYARSYNNLAYIDIAKLPFFHFFNGLPTALVRDGTTFPLYFILKEELEKRIIIENPTIKAILIGGIAGAALFPITAPLSLISDSQKKNPEIDFTSTVKTLYKEGGLKRFVKGGSGSLGMMFAYGAFFSIAKKLTASAKAENEEEAYLNSLKK